MTDGWATETTVAAIVRREGGALLVRHASPGSAATPWMLPGERVRGSESLTETLQRAVHTQSGLILEQAGQVAYIVQVQERDEEIAHSARVTTTIVFEAISSQTNDGLRADARFWPLMAAAEELTHIPFRSLREPAISYLSGQIGPGSTWLYQRRHDGADTLVSRLPGELATRDVEGDEEQGPTRVEQVETEGDPNYSRRAGLVAIGCVAFIVCFLLVIVIGIIAVHK